MTQPALRTYTNRSTGRTTVTVGQHLAGYVDRVGPCDFWPRGYYAVSVARDGGVVPAWTEGNTLSGCIAFVVEAHAT